jgi:hypothetical protein
MKFVVLHPLQMMMLLCCIVIPACTVLLFYCKCLIDLYRRMVTSYLCNCRVYFTQVKRLVLRILYPQAVNAFISHKYTCKGGSYSPSLSDLFWLFGTKCYYHSSSVWVRNERVSFLCGCCVDQFCIRQRTRLSMYQSGTRRPKFIRRVQPQQRCQLNPLTPELNPSAQRCLTRFFYWGFCFLNRAFR